LTIIRYFRELIDLPALARNLMRHRELIRTMTWRDFNARYRASFGGLFWSVFRPLVMMIIYTVVFSLFLKVRFTTDASPFTFSVYLLCGLLPWNALSEGLEAATGVIRGNVNLVKRVVFPLEILPINLALTATIQQLIGFVLLVPLAWLVSGKIFWTPALTLVILVFQLWFVIGLNWIVASLAVYLPDLAQMVSLVLLVWMFLTPIFYPIDVVPTTIRGLFLLNPMARLVQHYRDVFLNGIVPNLHSLSLTGVFCLFVFALGYFWFMRTKRGFADVL
jgi:lipopolysaccharide transport system permease protein